MAQYDEMFREEANEQLEIAEQALLSYESNPSLEYIEEAFRALHTFKGAAHIFSLTNLGDFAHKIESILDGIRHGVLFDEPRITDKLLTYLDHLKKLMNDPDIEDKATLVENSNLVREIDTLSAKISDKIKQSDQNKEEALLEAFIEEEDQVNISTYYLTILPQIEITTESGHPVFNILEDVQELGEARLSIQYHPENESACTHWDLYIACQSTKEDLEAQFMFIDDDVTVACYKVANFNLFKEMGFEELLKVLDKTDVDSRLTEITAYVESLKDALVPEESQTEGDGKNTKTTSIRVSTDKIDVLMNLVSELVTDQASLNLLSSRYADPELEGMAENMDRHIRQLRDIVFEMTLVPIERMIGKFKRMVRDCATSVGKEVNFNVTGENTELDKTFIDSLSDPIMHILRNSVDHGIETPEERTAKGKPLIGTVNLDAYYSGANVHIEIYDDGRGLSSDAIRSKALEKGLIKQGENLSEQEVYNLIFLPGFSTAKNVTEVSGRGVGMDVVKKNVESIRGEIDIESKEGVGTKFIIKVPLTLSIIDGLLIRVDKAHYVLPLQTIKKCYEIKYELLNNTFSDLLVLDDEQIPFINLRDELLSAAPPDIEYTNAIVVQCRYRKLVIIADEIIGEYQAVLKPVGEYYKKQEFVSGATILGDGSVALVLDADKLVEQKLKLATP
uniref:Chemotaxis protein CheA n=1 Tax=Roseihalotalea indica TaxID=2867963 RepID=A0AA49GLW6_9BACT|nr:chemotaxis protein CheA [Tunicatimonas sp. TK19036]